MNIMRSLRVEDISFKADHKRFVRAQRRKVEINVVILKILSYL